MTEAPAAVQRTIGGLLVDIRKARRWLGPNNVANRMLRECELAICELGQKLADAKAEIEKLQNL